jgi:methylated-DNA-[protein]-cysteine S-methyltransferase
VLEFAVVNVAENLRLRLVAGPSGLRRIEFEPWSPVTGSENPRNPLLAEAGRQLREYFTGARRAFEIPLEMAGTAFQKCVWQELLTIPYGQTRSYSQVAASLGATNAVRAVGTANGANPIPVIVPCHRVIGAGGNLVGYGGGLPLKKRLLELEGAWSAAFRW